jgi:hypothetical protein
MKVIYRSDRGHGWYAVKVKDIPSEVLSKVSSFSYISKTGSTVYLEEDCDASLVLRELESRGHGFEISEKHSSKRHWIRSLGRFYANAPKGEIKFIYLTV